MAKIDSSHWLGFLLIGLGKFLKKSFLANEYHSYMRDELKLWLYDNGIPKASMYTQKSLPTSPMGLAVPTSVITMAVSSSTPIPMVTPWGSNMVSEIRVIIRPSLPLSLRTDHENLSMYYL